MRPFVPTAEQLAKAPELCNLFSEMEARLNRNGDIPILIDGEEGNGKSTLGWRLAKMLDPNFSLAQVAWGLPQAVMVGSRTPKGGVVLVDEAVEGLQAREAMSKPNKLGQKWLQVCRARNLILIVCYPSIWDIDVYSREHRLWLRFWVEDLGLAKVYERSKSPWVREAIWRTKIPGGITYGPIPEDDLEWQMYGQMKDNYIQEIEHQMEVFLGEEDMKQKTLKDKVRKALG